MANNKKSGYQSHLDELGIEFDVTDMGNADRFQANFKNGFKFVPEENQWIVFDGRHWTHKNAASAVHNLGEEAMKRIYNEARDCKSKQGQFLLTTHARRSQNKAKIDPMIGLLKHRYSVSITDFDNDPELINCRNGVLNLKTGELIAHSEEQLFIKLADVDYKPQAKCPQWEQFLGDIFLGDKELIQYVQRAIGYALTGHTKEHKLFLMYGLGSNGKTTLIETVLTLLGDYGRTSEFSNFLDTDKSDVRAKEAVGMLKGIRFATASETGSTKKWNEALIKKITGGDTLIGAGLHKASFEFSPTHKLFFQANHLPGVKDASHGFWRRMVVIPFRKKFEGSADTKGLRSILLDTEREGIFAWLCEGARLYLTHGLGAMPEACKEATDSYRAEMDILGRFIAECLEDAPGQTIVFRDLYEEYEKWCTSRKEEPTPARFFSDAMSERGIFHKHNNKGTVFLNMRLKPIYHHFRGVAIEAPFEVSSKEDDTDSRKERYNPDIDYFEEWEKGAYQGKALK